MSQACFVNSLPFFLALLLGFSTPAALAAGTATCTGKFPNPITDICWSCILPISIGSARIANFGDQEDTDNPSSPVCSCGVNPEIGRASCRERVYHKV